MHDGMGAKALPMRDAVRGSRAYSMPERASNAQKRWAKGAFVDFEPKGLLYDMPQTFRTHSAHHVEDPQGEKFRKPRGDGNAHCLTLSGMP